jgi:hypothetical protein
MYVCMYVCMHVYTHVYTYVSMYVCMYACMYVCMYVVCRTHHAKSHMQKEACWDAGLLALPPPAQVLRLYSSSITAL